MRSPLIGPSWNRPCPVFRCACESPHAHEGSPLPAFLLLQSPQSWRPRDSEAAGAGGGEDGLPEGFQDLGGFGEVAHQFFLIALAMSPASSFMAPPLPPPNSPHETEPFSILSKSTSFVALSVSRNKQYILVFPAPKLTT